MDNCTVVILTLDEEQRIGEAVAAARACDFPVLIVDGGSTDATEEVAARSGARTVRRAFDDFASQRNWALSQAESPYVLFVDADERIAGELAVEVRYAVAANVDGATVPTLDYFAGRWLLHGGACPQRHLRLLRREACRFSGQVHERVSFDVDQPTIRDLETPLLHLSHMRLTNYLQKLDRYTEVESSSLSAGSPALTLARGAGEALAVLVHRIVLKAAWRDGRQGVVAAVSYAFYRFTIRAKTATRDPVDEPTVEAGLARWSAVRESERF